MKNRIYFLDNLRTFLIFLVVLYHSALVYQGGMESSWIVSDPVKSKSIGLLGMYLDVFVMFIMFFVSGYFMPTSLYKKTDWELIKSKAKRIMLPWLIAVITLIPLYKIIFLYSRGLPQEEWYSYFHLFQRTGTDLGFFANNPLQHWLWFLPVLFLFQIIYLGLSKTKLLSINISIKTAVIAIFVISLIYSSVISIYGLKGWFHSSILHFQRERFLVYFLIFLLGSLCYKLRIFDSDTRNKKWYILSNVVLTIALTLYTVIALNLFFNIVYPDRNYYFVSNTIDKIAYYAFMLLTMLSFLHIIVDAFRFKLNKSYNFLERLNKSSYYVYIIHMVVIGGVALVLMNMAMPAFLKFIILTLLSYTLSNLIVLAYYKFIQPKKYLKLAVVGVYAVTFFIIANEKSTKAAPRLELEQKALDEVAIIPNIGLHEAVLLGDVTTIEQHIKAGSNIDIKEPMGGSSPLITSATFGKSKIALILIKAGADVNFKNNEGSTALHTAAFFCRTQIVEALLANGSDISIKNKAGSTAYESVSVPFDVVKGVYDYFGKTLGPLGLTLDFEQIKEARPKIAEMLKKEESLNEK